MHLDENDVARYVDGRLTEEERREMEAHLAGCPRCRNQVAAVRRIQEEGTGLDVPSTAGLREQAEALGPKAEEDAPNGHVGRRALAIAAVAALLLGVAGLLYWQLRGPGPSQLRSSTEAPTLPVKAPADGATVPERPVFVYTSVSKALAYRVILKAPDGTVLWKEDTTTTRVPLPPDVPLTKGTTYLWRAEALRSDGTTLRSTLRTFTFAP